MYMSDYLYAYGSGGEQTCSTAFCPNWLTDTSNDTWTMTFGGYVGAYRAHAVLYRGNFGNGIISSSIAVRPVFYLKKEIYITNRGATGSSTDPFVLSY